MNDHEPLIPKHGRYRRLKSFQVAQLAYDVTVRFCDQYVEKRSRTRDQMVQAARSGVQNIAEGSSASATSKKTELKLTQVARASLEELRLDYEDFLSRAGSKRLSRSTPHSSASRRCSLKPCRRCRRGLLRNGIKPLTDTEPQEQGKKSVVCPYPSVNVRVHP